MVKRVQIECANAIIKKNKSYSLEVNGTSLADIILKAIEGQIEDYKDYPAYINFELSVIMPDEVKITTNFQGGQENGND